MVVCTMKTISYSNERVSDVAGWQEGRRELLFDQVVMEGVSEHVTLRQGLEL